MFRQFNILKLFPNSKIQRHYLFPSSDSTNSRSKTDGFGLNQKITEINAKRSQSDDHDGENNLNVSLAEDAKEDERARPFVSG